ncbi:MAG: antirepressor protein KilAC domain [Bacteriophage sp.]|jgi:phage antirepressor YoqD-like protein|uniref:phage antirepressor KilAC domain-containing protein n=1 Tax=Escherichia coli TaxID=562 RepID=UPI000DA59655|nr:phage antirepressor KilAC domain-containing protein [Escherichia coli]EBI5640558.1 phage antirepressor Ant [Salmonella enterica]EBO5357885.1 phage antirepressor Ant [Salmonella enterica subsp. enterica serovar Infantis]ECT2696361.1 phage antirepressor Ant [Salmonella enterica subsp. enterica serovar Montevideo]EEE3807860.1 phage antirepressor Ant [Salmonella enterica subsp. enterica serovar Oslo]EFN7223292.1 phage antirepressor Ant [Escherichia coli O21:H34]EIV3431514.1 phage antirepressor
MKTPLVTRNDIAEAIALHTACMPTREIPGAIANYFMITRRFYTRTDKAVINKLLIAEIRDYLIEQGRLRYATVAAEMRKEAHRMTGNNLNVEKPAPVASATPAPAVNIIPNTGDTIDSLTLLKMVNEARKLCGEPEVRNNKFIEKILDELDGEHYTKSVVEKMNKTSMLVITMTFKQALRVAARESKAVRRSLIDKLEELQQANSPTPSIPQTLPEALRLAAELAEQKMQLEQQLVAAAPKVDFADRVSVANGILIGNFAKVVGLKQNALFSWLRQNGILMAFGARKNVPRQQYINAGYFTVKEVVLDDENGYQIRLTPQLTGKGQQWLTRKLLDAGLLKPVAIG